MTKAQMTDFQKNNLYVIRNKENKDFYVHMRNNMKEELVTDFDKATTFSYNMGCALLEVIKVPKLQLIKVRTVLNEIEERRTNTKR